jgi:hypothetical protein
MIDYLFSGLAAGIFGFVDYFFKIFPFGITQ